MCGSFLRHFLVSHCFTYSLEQGPRSRTSRTLQCGLSSLFTLIRIKLLNAACNHRSHFLLLSLDWRLQSFNRYWIRLKIHCPIANFVVSASILSRLTSLKGKGSWEKQDKAHGNLISLNLRQTAAGSVVLLCCDGHNWIALGIGVSSIVCRWQNPNLKTRFRNFYAICLKIDLFRALFTAFGWWKRWLRSARFCLERIFNSLAKVT